MNSVWSGKGEGGRDESGGKDGEVTMAGESKVEVAGWVSNCSDGPWKL